MGFEVSLLMTVMRFLKVSAFLMILPFSIKWKACVFFLALFAFSILFYNRFSFNKIPQMKLKDIDRKISDPLRKKAMLL